MRRTHCTRLGDEGLPDAVVPGTVEVWRSHEDAFTELVTEWVKHAASNRLIDVVEHYWRTNGIDTGTGTATYELACIRAHAVLAAMAISQVEHFAERAERAGLDEDDIESAVGD